MEIALSQGKTAVIDDQDWALVAPYSWYAARNQGGVWYAVAPPLTGNKQGTRVKMHNVVTGRKWIDHRDGDGLNNRRSNLREASNALNQQNTGPRGGSSRYKGVAWVSSKGRWRVAFRFDNRHHFVGYFADEEAAARAYDAAILPLAGEFSRLNFPGPGHLGQAL